MFGEEFGPVLMGTEKEAYVLRRKKVKLSAFGPYQCVEGKLRRVQAPRVLFYTDKGKPKKVQWRVL